jgi:hypothetical protein
MQKGPAVAGPFLQLPTAYAAAVSTYSSGAASNSFLQFSEQKNISCPQTAYGIRFSCRPLSFHRRGQLS